MTSDDSMHGYATGEETTLSLAWSIILNTLSEATTLKLLDRIARRVSLPLLDIWIRPWVADVGCKELRFRTTCPGDTTRPAATVGAVLDLAARISSTWTIVMPGDAVPGGPGVLYQAWTPRDFRTFTLEGISNASLVVEIQPPRKDEPTTDTAGVRCCRRGNLLINMVDRVLDK